MPLLNDTVKLRMTTAWFLQNRKMKQTKNLNTNSRSQVCNLLTIVDIVLSVGIEYDVKYSLGRQVSSLKPAPPCKELLTIRLSLLLGDSRYIRKKPVKNCLNARAKMTSDKFDDERLLARKTNENKMKNG